MDELNYYRPITPADYPRVITMKLREADAEELCNATGLPSAQEALALSLVYSKYTWVFVFKGEIEAVFGLGCCRVNDEDLGNPWFMSTDKFDEFSFTFARESKRVVSIMEAMYPKMINQVSIYHIKAIIWLQWLGFDVDQSKVYNSLLTDKPFYFFRKGGNTHL